MPNRYTRDTADEEVGSEVQQETTDVKTNSEEAERFGYELAEKYLEHLRKTILEFLENQQNLQSLK